MAQTDGPSRPRGATGRKVVEALTFAEAEADDHCYWRGRSPRERIQHLERLRVKNYGSEVIDQGLQRVLAVAERSRR